MATKSGYQDGRLDLGIQGHILDLTSNPTTKTITVAPSSRDADSPYGVTFLREGLVMVPSTVTGLYKQFGAPADAYTITVLNATDGAFTVTVNGTPFTHTASTNTIEQIRDALIVLINAGAEPVTAAPSGTTVILLTADTDVLPVVSTTANMSITADDGSTASDDAVILKQMINVGTEPVVCAAYSAGSFRASALIVDSLFDWSRVQRLKRNMSL